ncbi:MAG: CHAT domain-containing tetratricopeptide repeat protein [Cyclobacteriaceae bacterium]
MSRIIIILVFFTFSFSVSGQKFLKKLKQAVEEQLEEKSSDLADDRMNKARLEQLVKDTSNYNYIFSQGNRASFFANRDSKENLLLTLSKNYEDEEVEKVELETYEKAFDSNRTGEMSIYINPDAAILNFLEALGLLTNEFGVSRTLLDSAFDISSLADMDTLSMEEKYALGKTIANIAIVIHAEGKYNLSDAFIQETTNYFKEEIYSQSIALASLYNNRAVIAQSKGKYTEAEDFFNRSEKIIADNNKTGSLSHAIITSNRALLYNETGQYEEAISYIQKASTMAAGELREKGRDNVGFKINEGLIYYSSGDYEQAEMIFNEVLELKRKRMARNQTDYANVENYLASVLMESGKTTEVPDLLNDALQIFEKKYSTSHPAYIKTKHNLGRYHIYSGNFDEAAAILQEVNQSYEQFFGKNHPDYLNSLEDMSVISWKKEDFETASSQFRQVIASVLEQVENFFGAMSEYEKSQYWAKVRPSILKFYAYAAEHGKADPTLLTEMYNIHLKTKGILLSASTKVREQILNGDNEELKKVYASWVSAKEQLILYYTYSKQQLAEQKIDLNAVEAEANRLEKELSRMSAAFAQSNKLPTATLKDIKAKLGSSDAAIETIGFPKFDRSFSDEKNYAFLIATSSSLHPDLVLLENGRELDQRYAKAYRKMVEIKAEDNITYDKFWKPVDEKLAGKSNVYLSLDGVYYQVNVGALRRADDTYVSDAFNLHLYSSTRDLLKVKKKTSTKKKADFFGYPDYGIKGLLVALPGTKDEIDAVSRITRTKGYATSVFMQKEASEENFKQIQSPSLLHIATHGFFLQESQSTGDKVFGIEVNQAKDNPLLRSGLMLANAEQTMESATKGTEANAVNNGVLTAYEVITLDLKDTDLVVLSACETGLGEIKSGEGVYGLQRAFQVAGAESVIMSLWKVSDEATRQLMTTFYQEWMNGKSKEQAFFSAQKALRKNFPEPYYWGAFVMLN